MKKQMKWGLATLLLLLGIAAVFLFIDKDTETEPEMTLGQPTKDLLKKGVKSPQQANAPDTQRPPPPDDGREYVWHGNHWDPVDAPKLVDSLFEAPELTDKSSETTFTTNIEFPTQSDIEQMPYEQLEPLSDLLQKKARVAREADDIHTSIRYTNANTLTIAEIRKRTNEAWNEVYDSLGMPRRHAKGPPTHKTVVHIRLAPDGTVIDSNEETVSLDKKGDTE